MDSRLGRYSIQWKLSAGQLEVELVIPPNGRATLIMPTSETGAVMESGKPAVSSKGVRLIGAYPDGDHFEIGSGHYQFTSPYHLPDRSGAESD